MDYVICSSISINNNRNGLCGVIGDVLHFQNHYDYLDSERQKDENNISRDA